VRILASGDVPFWTVATYDTASNETYSMNDRSSIGVNVDIVFVTPAQMLQLRRVMPRALERSVLVELAIRKAMWCCARSPRHRARGRRRELRES
jgi:uncharacterized membrane protein